MTTREYRDIKKKCRYVTNRLVKLINMHPYGISDHLYTKTIFEIGDDTLSFINNNKICEIQLINTIERLFIYFQTEYTMNHLDRLITETTKYQLEAIYSSYLEQTEKNMNYLIKDINSIIIDYLRLKY